MTLPFFMPEAHTTSGGVGEQLKIQVAATVLPFTLLLTGGTTATLPTPPSQVRSLGGGTTTPLIPHSDRNVGVASVENDATSDDTAALVRQLRQDSGLTWDQLSRFFGVSRRAVHLWASGGRMNSTHLEYLHQLLAEIESLDASTADARRSELLRVGSDGRNRLSRLRAANLKSSGYGVGAYAPEELLGAVHDRAGKDS